MSEADVTSADYPFLGRLFLSELQSIEAGLEVRENGVHFADVVSAMERRTKMTWKEVTIGATVEILRDLIRDDLVTAVAGDPGDLTESRLILVDPDLDIDLGADSDIDDDGDGDVVVLSSSSSSNEEEKKEENVPPAPDTSSDESDENAQEDNGVQKVGCSSSSDDGIEVIGEKIAAPPMRGRGRGRPRGSRGARARGAVFVGRGGRGGIVAAGRNGASPSRPVNAWFAQSRGVRPRGRPPLSTSQGNRFGFARPQQPNQILQSSAPSTSLADVIARNIQNRQHGLPRFSPGPRKHLSGGGNALSASSAAGPLFPPQPPPPPFEYDQGEIALDSDCEDAAHFPKCRVKLERLSEEVVRGVYEDKAEKNVSTAAVRRKFGTIRRPHYSTLLGQKLKVERVPDKFKDDYFSKSRFASEVAEVALLSDRPVRSTRGQKVNYDDEIYKDNEFDEALTSSDDDDEEEKRPRKKSKKSKKKKKKKKRRRRSITSNGDAERTSRNVKGKAVNYNEQSDDEDEEETENRINGEEPKEQSDDSEDDRPLRRTRKAAGPKVAGPVSDDDQPLRGRRAARNKNLREPSEDESDNEALVSRRRGGRNKKAEESDDDELPLRRSNRRGRPTRNQDPGRISLRVSNRQSRGHSVESNDGNDDDDERKPLKVPNRRSRRPRSEEDLDEEEESRPLRVPSRRSRRQRSKEVEEASDPNDDDVPLKRPGKRKRKESKDGDDQPLRPRRGEKSKLNCQAAEEEAVTRGGRRSIKRPRRLIEYEDDNGEEEDEEADVPIITRGRGRPPIIKADDQDSDFEADSGSESESGSSGATSSEMSTDSDDFKPDRQASRTNVQLLHTIDPRLPKNWVSKREHHRVGILPRGAGDVKHWLMFARYIKREEGERETLNPFRPPEFSVGEFLQELANGGASLNDLASARKFIAATVLEDNDYFANVPLPPCRLKDMRQVRAAMKRLENSVFLAPQTMAHNLSLYCSRLPNPENPFTCSTTTLAKFMREYYVGGRFATNAKNYIQAFSQFHCYKFSNNGASLLNDDEIQKVLRVEKAIAENLLSVKDCTEAELADILELTPDFKYYKYVKTASAWDFWRERFVFEVLEDVFNDDEFTNSMDLSVAARMLGVTPEMVYNNLCRTILPVDQLPMVYSEFAETNPGKNNPDAFWRKVHVRYALDKVRNREGSAEEGAYDVGACLKAFCDKVGPLKKKEEKKKKKEAAKPKPKVTALEKQLKREEGISGSSEYDQTRLKNIQERLALFQQLGFNSLKDKLKGEKKERQTTAKEVQSREKSKRLKAKASQASKQAVLADAGTTIGITETPVPVSDCLTLNELASLGDGFHAARKFSSCLKQELLQPDTGDNGKKGEIVGDYHIKGNVFLSGEKLTSLAAFPDRSLEFVAGGDANGGVSLWFRGSGNVEDEEDAGEVAAKLGKNCSFRPHSDEVIQMEFSLADKTKLISGSLDGYIRICDLLSGSVSAPYKWNRHHSDKKLSAITGFAQRDEHNLVLLRDDLSLANFDLRTEEVSISVEQLPGGRADSVSVDPKNPNRFCLFGPESTCVSFYDARSAVKPFHSISRSAAVVAEYSPDGERFLIAKGGVTTSKAVVHDIASDGVEAIPAIDDDSAATQLSNLKFRMVNGISRTRPCAWNHAQPDTVFVATKFWSPSCDHALAQLKASSTCLSSVCALTGNCLELITDDFMLGAFGMTPTTGTDSSFQVAAFNASGNGVVTIVGSNRL